MEPNEIGRDGRDLPDERGAVTTAQPRRGRWQRLWGPVFGPVWGTSFLLSASMFLPLCLVGGCNGKQPWYPYGIYVHGPSVSEFFQGLLFNWPYAFGVLAGMGAFAVAWTGKAKHFRMLWAGYCGTIVLSVLGLWSVMGSQWRERGVPANFEQFAEEGLLLVP